MNGFCECGCGEKAPLAPQSSARFGWVKGQPLRFVRGHNNRGRAVKLDRWETVDGGSSTQCWRWILNTNPVTGYGVAKRYRRQLLAHRLVYEELRGPIPDGLELDHLCRNRWCVNPDHLEPVTHQENIRRGANTKLSRDQHQAVLDHPGPARVIAEEFGISIHYAYKLRAARS